MVTRNDTVSQQGSRIVMSGAVVRRNEAHNGIEIAFPEKPTREIINTLKDSGYKWSNFSKVWYIKFTEERYAEAQKMVGQMAG